MTAEKYLVTFCGLQKGVEVCKSEVGLLSDSFFRPLPFILLLIAMVPAIASNTTCYYTAVPWTTVAYDQVLQGVYYELDYCVTYPDEGSPGDLGGLPDTDPPDCTGNLTLDHTLSMGYGMSGTSIQDPTKGRWGNTFRLQGNAQGMSNGTHEMKAYLQGAGIINLVRIIDWDPRMTIDLAHVTRNLNVDDYNGSEELAWYIGARYICNDGSNIKDEEDGTVQMYRFGDYYRLNGSWTTPTRVAVEPVVRVEDCLVREFSYGDETEYEHQVQLGYSWEGINAQLGFVLKKKYSSGLKIQGPAGRWYTFSKITRETTVPVKQNSYDFQGHETNMSTFNLSKILYSYEVTDVSDCPVENQ